MLHVVHTRVHIHTKERAYHEHPLRTYSTENCFALIVISLSLARWNVPLLISGRLLAVCSAHGIRYIRLICRANENRLQERRFWTWSSIEYRVTFFEILFLDEKSWEKKCDSRGGISSWHTGVSRKDSMELNERRGGGERKYDLHETRCQSKSFEHVFLYNFSLDIVVSFCRSVSWFFSSIAFYLLWGIRSFSLRNEM